MSGGPRHAGRRQLASAGYHRPPRRSSASEFYTAAINPIRRPADRSRGVRWEGPSGKQVLRTVITTCSVAARPGSAALGPGRSAAAALDRAGSKRPTTATRSFLYCRSPPTPVRVDNGSPPDARMPDFVRRWNDERARTSDGVHHRHRFRPTFLNRNYAKVIPARSAVTGPITGPMASAPRPSKSASTVPPTRSRRHRRSAGSLARRSKN